MSDEPATVASDVPAGDPPDPTPASGWWAKGLLFGGLLVAAGVLYYNFRDVLTLEAIAAREQSLRAFRDESPVLVLVIAFVAYVAVTGLSIPGATVLTLAYGWYLGFWPALVLVSFASTTGATLAFLLSRYLFRDAIRQRFGERMQKFEENLAREGPFYLFTLRLVPAVPFFVLNAVMGLTPIAVGTFWWVSQIGMLPGTIVYVYAGSTIPSLERIDDGGSLVSWQLLGAFALLGLFPLVVRKAVGWFRADGAPGAEANHDEEQQESRAE